MGKHTTVTIPVQLAEKIKKRINNSGFSSISSYVTYVLRTIESDMDEKIVLLDKKETGKIKERLKKLGYI